MAFDIMPPLSHAEAMDRAARSLPNDDAGLIAAAKEVLVSFDAATTARDHDAAQQAFERMEAVVYKLKGGDQFDAQDAWDRLHCELRVDDGTVPLWGQPGRFVVTLDEGIRVIVEIDELMQGRNGTEFSCSALDFEYPFLSSNRIPAHSSAHDQRRGSHRPRRLREAAHRAVAGGIPRLEQAPENPQAGGNRKRQPTPLQAIQSSR